MYVIVSIISYFIRLFFAPNPFESFGSAAMGYNLVFGGLLIPISYGIIGALFDNVESSVLLSLLFLVVYMAISIVLKVVLDISHNLFVVGGLLFGVFLVFVMAIRKLKDY